MEPFALYFESGTGDGVAVFGAYEVWRKPSAEFGEHTEDALHANFAAALHNALDG